MSFEKIALKNSGYGSNLNVHQRGTDKEDVGHIFNKNIGIKRNKIVLFAETWTDVETTTQNELSQKEEKKYCIILFICGI